MNSDSTLLYILVIITVLHFLVGIGYLLYKLGGSSKTNNKKKQASDKD